MNIQKALWAALLVNILSLNSSLAEDKAKPSPTKKKISKAIDKFDADVKEGVRNVKQELKKIDKKLSE